MKIHEISISIRTSRNDKIVSANILLNQDETLEGPADVYYDDENNEVKLTLVTIPNDHSFGNPNAQQIETRLSGLGRDLNDYILKAYLINSQTANTEDVRSRLPSGGSGPKATKPLASN